MVVEVEGLKSADGGRVECLDLWMAHQVGSIIQDGVMLLKSC